MKNISHRFKRLIGQLEKVEAEIANGKACKEVIPQLLAVRGALQATILVYLEESLAECAEKSSPKEMSLVLETIIKKL